LEEKDAASHHAAGFTAALVSPPSDIFAGQSALVSLSGAPRREAIIASPIAMHGAFSSRGRGYPGTLMGCMAHFRQVLSDAQRQAELERFHAQHPQKFRRPPYDPTLTALRPVLERGMPMVLRASSALGIGRALGMSDEFALNVILDGGREAWRVAPTLAEARTPVIVALGFEEEPKLVGEKDAAKGSVGEDESAGSDGGEPEKEEEEPKSWEELPGKERFATPLRVQEDQHRKWRESVENAKVLEDHGVKFVFGTQGKQKAFWKDLHLAMQHGLSADVALRALTIAPAALFGVDGSLGTIEAGKAAHLTLVNGRLGDEKASVAYVFVDGQKFEVEGRKDSKESDGASEEPTGPASLPGTWSVAVQSERGEIEMTWVLRKEGNGYAGTLETRFGEMELTQASLKGNTIKLTFETEFDGQPFSLSFSGKIGGDSGSGTGSSSMGESTWTATRTAKPKGGAR
ncbi:MAG: amidohydrolase family protein, partial [Planctomycetota bacterium]